MTAWQYIRASLRNYRRVHLAVAAGVAVTTAVITGALLVGDSMRGSLRDLALRSLGHTDTILIAQHPFREQLAQELLAAGAASNRFNASIPLLLTQGAAAFRTDEGAVRRAASLSVYGTTTSFWRLGHPGSDFDPVVMANVKKIVSPVQGIEIALTQNVAQELGVAVGDFVVLRIPLPGATPADSALGEKEDASTSRRLKVAQILDEDDRSSMARFSLHPAQVAPRNAFLPLDTLQDMLKLQGKANAVLLAAPEIETPRSEQAEAALSKELRPTLADYGVAVEPETLQVNPQPRPDYLRISADRLVLPQQLVTLAEKLDQRAHAQPVITYLANTITAGDRKIPYSTVVGVDSTAELGPLLDDDGKLIQLADNEIALNDWAADDLQVKVGDNVTITWYEPETTHGMLREHAPLRLKLRAIVPLADAAGHPTRAADPAFAPELPGVTDAETIASWKLPFPLVETVRDKDEDYWKERRTTPKAFVSFNLARRLWSSRWGSVSVLRIPVSHTPNPEPPPNATTVAAKLQSQLDPAAMGMALIPAKAQALAAASGTTPFDGLFLGFSFFLMASAIMLTVLLFRLGVEARAREVGLLLATGLSAKRVRNILGAEAFLVAAAGALVGALAGVAYAALMVHGLNTWWVAATAAPFLQLHVTARSIAIGFIAGLVAALATILWSLRRFAKLPARQLLAGDHQPPLSLKSASRLSRVWLPAACLLAALALGAAAVRFEGEAQAGAFFGGGALALVGILAAVRGRLREATAASPTQLTLAGLAARNARRNPSRTMLSLSLAATASFLIVALSAFRLAPTNRGTGGFDLLATSDLPLHYDPDRPDGQTQLGFSKEARDQLHGVQFVGFRVQDGQDASCLNLYQTTQPRILGAPHELLDLSQFQWAPATAPPAPSPSVGRDGEGGEASTKIASRRLTGGPSWSFLEADLGADADGRPIVPMVLDRNTAFYSLKLYAIGDRLTIRDAAGREVTLQLVGMLANSILQGSAVISEANFLKLYPDVAGRRFFLIRRGPTSHDAAGLASLLETQLEDFGFDAVDARTRLEELMAVQNTYLSTFQSLGALGLLLGAVGLAVVQLRSVIERRGELALMQAAGFRRRRLSRMVLAESLVLLLGGLAIGSAAALAAVLPHAAVEQVGAPWATLALLLALVAAAGALAAWLASRTALRAPLLPALRGE